ncbi:MAG: hypothetical protein M1830_007183 [Pleopsidium flavum]|nr:MAG: hypothetical protein M1830_007183 [Pleopsidium flavum]
MEGAKELQTLGPVEIPKGSTYSELEAPSSYDRDRDELARLGKKQVLKRPFGFMSILGFGCTMMVTWEGILVLFVSAFENGGPAGFVYGFLIVWIGTMAVFTTMAEMASMAPTSGGQYHWISMLAPPSSRKFLSYITGWLTVCGWQALVASGGYLSGTLIQGLIVMNYPTYTFERWHGTLLFWACIFLAVIINTVISSILPKLEGLILVLHILGFFAILIPLVYMAPHGSASDVFTVFLNEGGWPTQGLSFFIGLIGNVFSMLAKLYQPTFQMSEEIQNASTVVPRSMITSIALNGALGFGMLIAVLFCVGDIDAVLHTPTGYPFMEIFLQATKSTGGSTVMATIVTILGICATIGFLASSSRMTWSFARDRGLPGWQYLNRVEPRSSIPLVALTVTTTIACLLGLINIGSSTAFNDVISLTINGLYASYFICCSLLLWRRCTGAIKSPSDQSPPSFPNSTGTVQLTWGPWRVPGALGIGINAFGCVYLVIILFFSFWPPATPATASTMNWSVLMTGFVLGFSVVYYFVWGRRVYTGPVVEIEGGGR